MIYAGALKAMKRANRQKFGLIKMAPPYARVVRHRPFEGHSAKTISRDTHPTSFIALMNMPEELKPA